MELPILHDELIGRLQGFVNGDTLDAPSRLFYPLLKNNINNFNRLLYSKTAGSVYELLVQLEKKKNCRFEKSKKVLLQFSTKKTLSSREYANLLGILYSELEGNLARKMKGKSVRVRALYDYDEWKQKAIDERLKPLHELHSYFARRDEYFHRLILHGSCSTLDYTNFSDIDFLVVLKRGVILDPEKLVEARDVVLKARKYQDVFNSINHHGFLVLGESDLNFYRQSYMALEAFKYATVFDGGGKVLEFGVTNEMPMNEKIKQEKLKRKLNYILFLKPKNHYELFDKISSFLLLPTLFLARQGKYVYKRNSFGLFKKQLTPEEGKMLDEVSEAREKWPFEFISPHLWHRKLAHSLLNPLLFKFIVQNVRFLHSARIKDYEPILEKINYLTKQFMQRMM